MNRPVMGYGGNVMQALQLTAFGQPAEVVQLVTLPASEQPGPHEVLVAVEAAPIHGSDLLMIAGAYGYRPALPAMIGTEGVGRVLAIGDGVSEIAVGDRV